MITKDAPRSLVELHEEIQKWRAERSTLRAHIPKQIWDQAADLAKSMGAGRVARKLGLNPTRLKERAGLKVQRAQSAKKIASDQSSGSTVPQLIEVARINIPAAELPMKSSDSSPHPSAMLTTPNGATLTLFQDLGASELEALASVVGGGRCCN